MICRRCNREVNVVCICGICPRCNGTEEEMREEFNKWKSAYLKEIGMRE